MKTGSTSGKMVALILALLLVSFSGLGQKVAPEKLVAKIDSLAAVGLAKSALVEVNKLDQWARQHKNTPLQLRATFYRLMFLSYLEEKALVSVITTLKKDVATSVYPVKPVLQSVLAEVYWRYYQQNRYQFHQRSQLSTPSPDFTQWDLRTILQAVSSLHQAALTPQAPLQKTPVTVLGQALVGDSVSRPLRPTLYDLLVHRALDFYLQEESDLPKARDAFSLNNPAFFADSRTFANISLPTADTSANLYKGLLLLQQATAFHLAQKHPQALTDLDLKRIQFLYHKSTFRAKDALYRTRLQEIATTQASNQLAADALYLLGRFYQQKDSLVTAVPYLDKAVQQYPGTLGAHNANALREQILKKSVTVTVEEEVPAHVPLLALATYTNLTSFTPTLFRLSAAQLEEVKVLQQRIGRHQTPTSAEATQALLKFLHTLSPLVQSPVQLPDFKDHQAHTAEFKIAPQAPGLYGLLVQGGTTADTTLLHFSSFKVSNLAYTSRVNPDGKAEVRVLHRVTGKPLASVQVQAFENFWQNGRQHKPKIGEGLTDAQGKITFTKNQRYSTLSFILQLDDDQLQDDSQDSWGVLKKEQEEEEKTMLFTDRQLYRPGQSIYFKGIQLLKQSNGTSLVKSKRLEIELKDVNRKNISVLEVTTNEFGSFSGSFQLPASVLTGYFTLQTEDGQLMVRVEEYKRPSFQISFDPIRKDFRLNDSVQVHGQAKAFSGYGLSQAKVQYKVMREAVYQPYDEYLSYAKRVRPSQEMEIASGVVTADAQGTFKITFHAFAEQVPETFDRQFSYRITATVTDASGETQETATTVKAGQKVLELHLSVPQRVLHPDSLKSLVQLTNLNGQLQQGQVQLELYEVKSPESLYKNRLWTLPDTSLWTMAQFQQLFPHYAPLQAAHPFTWQLGKKVHSQTLVTTAEKPAIMRLAMPKKLNAGLYLLKALGTSQNGDTVSTRQLFTYISKDQKHSAVRTQDWVIPLREQVKPGQKAAFLVGAGPGHVLVEVLKDAEIVSSMWLKTEEKQKVVEIPMLASYGTQVQVQFLTVSQNRSYSNSFMVALQEAEPSLNLHFTTFRNQLLPGQKETWNLRLTNGKKQGVAAEMVAGLYDASLDKLAPPQQWASSFAGLVARPNLGYYRWQTNSFVKPAVTQPVKASWYSLSVRNREYEHLNFFGYAYFGGYNYGYREYLAQIEQQKKAAETDKYLQEAYKHNAAQVKNGLEITGRIISKNGQSRMPGVLVQIEGTSIATSSNSQGIFRLKVPPKGRLVFTFIGYAPQVVEITKAGNLTIQMEGDGNSLQEVVVTGYGTVAKQSVTGASTQVQIRGRSSMAAPTALEGIESGAVYLMADAKENPVPEAIIRKNFQETAFFYPHLRTDAQGDISLEFTVPEALTLWRFQGLAHTSDLKYGWVEKEMITQKKLMVSPYFPRFLREGDTLTVSARVANLTAEPLSGNVNLQLYNALNNQPVHLTLPSSSPDQPFTLSPGTTGSVSYRLVVPANLSALTYRITAQTPTFSDGEENTLPVLPNAILVTESLPMLVRPGQTKSFTLEKLTKPNSTTQQNKTLTFEFTQNPVWQVVQALPYLMEYPYDCSEQIFSRFYANSLSTTIVQKSPRIKQVFDQWKASSAEELLSNLEKNQELKQVLLTETPWLREATSETEQKKRIALLFDLNKMEHELTFNLDKLAKMQFTDGSFPWFAGMPHNRYISQHILAGMGQLEKLGISHAQHQDFQKIKSKGLAYLHHVLLQDERNRRTQANNREDVLHSDQIHAWYARSYFAASPLPQELQPVWKSFLAQAALHWKFKSVYEQALLALTLHSFKQPALAQQMINSILERSKQSEELGMYWPQNQWGYFWYQSPVETQVLLIELFTETKASPNYLAEMKIWLLRHKQTNNWRTTKATAAACYALLLKSEDWLPTPVTSPITLAGKPLLTLVPNLVPAAGTGYLKTSFTGAAIQPAMGTVTIKNESTVPNWGALHWQYLERTDKVTAHQTQLQLKRQYFLVKTVTARETLVPVNAQNPPKVGDLLKVVLYLTSDRDMEYVHLKDLRPAGTEPVETLSGYKGQDGLYYYQATQDAATNFFLSYLRKGNYVFEYRLRVAHPGDFATGITTLQSMYAPEFNAHSEGGRIRFVKE